MEHSNQILRLNLHLYQKLKVRNDTDIAGSLSPKSSSSPISINKALVVIGWLLHTTYIPQQ